MAALLRMIWLRTCLHFQRACELLTKPADGQHGGSQQIMPRGKEKLYDGDHAAEPTTFGSLQGLEKRAQLWTAVFSLLCFCQAGRLLRLASTVVNRSWSLAIRDSSSLHCDCLFNPHAICTMCPSHSKHCFLVHQMSKLNASLRNTRPRGLTI